MKIEHIKKRQDGGGQILVTAYTWPDKLSLIEYFKLSKQAEKLLSSATPIVFFKAYNEKRPCFQIEVVVDKEFTDPYFKELKHMTGCNLTDTIDSEFLKKHYGSDLLSYRSGLCYTHEVVDIRLENQQLIQTVIVSAEDFNKKTAKENALAYAKDAVEDKLGYRMIHSEFIETSGGYYKPNPDYLKRMPVRPQFRKTGWLHRCLCAYWTKNYASPAQRKLISQDIRLMKKNRCKGGMANSNEGLRYDWNHSPVTWNQFKKM